MVSVECLLEYNEKAKKRSGWETIHAEPWKPG